MKNDISKRKTPFFCILKGLSNEQIEIILRVIYTLKALKYIIEMFEGISQPTGVVCMWIVLTLSVSTQNPINRVFFES